MIHRQDVEYRLQATGVRPKVNQHQVPGTGFYSVRIFFTALNLSSDRFIRYIPFDCPERSI